MKRILVTMLLIISGLSGFSQQWTAITSQDPEPGKVRLVSSSIENSVIQVNLPGFFLNEVVTPQGNCYSVEIENSTPILTANAPDLPKLTTSLVIPDQAGMQVRVVSSIYKDYPDIMIAPSKGLLMRDVDPFTVSYVFGEVYAADRFFPGPITETREPYIIRDVRGQTVIIYPFQYNPVTKTLRVYFNLTVELYKTGESGPNPLTSSTGAKKIPADFQSVLSHRFLNFDAMNYTPLDDYGNILVISYGPYMEAMQPWVSWKKAMGYYTEMIDKDSVGTTAAQIKSFIADYYNTKGLTHVLLVGDAPQIPTNTGGGLGGASDNAYGYIIGTDHYPELFVGRFSAETVEQVETQVQRSLEYEQNPQYVTDDWFTSVIGIASNQGPGDDNEYDYQHIRNLQDQCLDYTYTQNPELFDGSQGGNDAPGDPSPPMVATDVNDGAGLILYTGHGSKTSWGSSGFSNANVNQLNNVGMLPFIWSVACVNGQFMTGNPCFAEAWLRATQGGQPTGAIAFLGSTINQSWNPPMEGQDEMVNILTEADSTNIKRTFAGISMNGCMKMIDAYGADGGRMADTWTVFGDPTIMVRTANPEPIAVQYDTLLFVTDSTLAVYCNVANARVTLTTADTILATGLFLNDTAMLAFPPLVNPFDTIHLVVTAYNMIPFMGDLVVRDIPIPVVAGFTGVPNRVIPGNTVSFADTSIGNTITWRWHFPGGTPDVSYEQNPVIVYEIVGIYDVKLIAGDGFTTDSILIEGYIVADFPTLTGERQKDVNFTVSPNPNPGTFNLNIQTGSGGFVDITVYDLVGAILFSGRESAVASRLSKTISLPSLPDGIYFVKVTGTTTSAIRKLIIRK